MPEVDDLAAGQLDQGLLLDGPTSDLAPIAVGHVGHLGRVANPERKINQEELNRFFHRNPKQIYEASYKKNPTGKYEIKEAKSRKMVLIR